MRPRRRTEHSRRAAAIVFTLVFSGCSSSSSNAASDADVDAHVRDPSKNCVKPGSGGNEKGVGAYCEPGGAPCTGDAGSLLICTGGVPNVPEDAWFCTRGCSKDEDCGSDAFCISDPKLGTGCVPRSCLPPSSNPDAGVDAASE